MIEVDTLDNILEELGIEKVDYIKIDVEGIEEYVLRGFTKYRNGTTFHIETHTESNNEEVKKELSKMGAIFEDRSGILYGKFAK